MKTYSKIIKGKTVAIVGPAKYMIGKNLGKEIDSHDIVVRINRSIESCLEFGKDIGRRTDILYSCMIEKPENAGKIDVQNLINKNIKFVCIPPKSSFEGVAVNNDMITDYANEEKYKELKSKISTRIISATLNNVIAKEVKCRPNTGYLAIYDLLEHMPKKLSIYGFSFYLDGFITGSKSGIKSMNENEYANKCFDSKRHIQKNLWQFAKNSLLKDKLINCDSTLKSILKMNNFSKEEFKKINKKG